MTKYVWITTSFVGFHFWSGATNYLEYPHRHVFHVKVSFLVTENDRELEFIRLKEITTEYIKKEFEDKTFPHSCETIAEMIIAYLGSIKLPVRFISVSEDNENGAEVYLSPWDVKEMEQKYGFV